jgi:hypothetical protein
MLRKSENDDGPKVFTGSVFVEFDKDTSAQAAANAAEVSFKDEKLVRMANCYAVIFKL